MGHEESDPYDFVAWFPGVTREQVLAVLTHAEKSLAVV